ncbi:MAG TPA: carboxypeptidase regulatory-like domain-containing protein [Paludibaculum sp.]|jgi:hypothetical protein
MRYLFALLVTVSALAQQPATRPTSPRNYRSPYFYVSVTGTVTDADSGEPIVGARVKLITTQPNTSTREVEFVTKLGGRFGAGLANDQRLLIRVEADGYVDGLAALERGPVVIVPQRERERETVEFRLHRAAEIEGQLFDHDLEKPVPGVTVRAHWSIFDRGKRVLKPAGTAASSDAEGRFRLAGLPPADYFLEIAQKEQERIEERAIAARKPVEGYAREYWPGGGMLEAAIPLPLVAGGHLPLGSVFIRKSRMYRVHGNLATPSCGETSRHRLQLWEHREGRLVLRGDLLAHCNSAFTIHNLRPGQWTLETELQGVFDYQAEGSSTDFSITDKDVELALLPLPPLLIEYKFRGVAPNVTPVLKPKGRPEYTPGAAPLANRTRDLVLLAPPTEYVQASIPKLPERYCIREILYNGGTTDDGAFRVNRDAPSQIVEFTLSSKPASLSGKVVQREKPVAGAIVVIAPWPAALRAEWPKTTRTAAGDDGAFSFKGLAPGTWRVFAIDPALRLKLEQPGFLLSLIGRAEELTLAESANQMVELKPAEP